MEVEVMPDEQVLVQVNQSSLYKLAQFFQKEVTSVIDLYLKDSEKLMVQLKNHFTQNDSKYILKALQELRQNSLEIGAMQFSYLLLSLEISIREYRLYHWEKAYAVLKTHFNSVLDELATLRFMTEKAQRHSLKDY